MCREVQRDDYIKRSSGQGVKLAIDLLSSGIAVCVSAVREFRLAANKLQRLPFGHCRVLGAWDESHTACEEQGVKKKKAGPAAYASDERELGCQGFFLGSTNFAGVASGTSRTSSSVRHPSPKISVHIRSWSCDSPSFELDPRTSHFPCDYHYSSFPPRTS